MSYPNTKSLRNSSTCGSYQAPDAGLAQSGRQGHSDNYPNEVNTNPTTAGGGGIPLTQVPRGYVDSSTAQPATRQVGNITPVAAPPLDILEDKVR